MADEPKPPSTQDDLLRRSATLESHGLRLVARERNLRLLEAAIDARDLESYRLRDALQAEAGDLDKRCAQIEKEEAALATLRTALDRLRTALDRKTAGLKDTADRLNRRAAEIEANARGLVPPAPADVAPPAQHDTADTEKPPPPDSGAAGAPAP